MQTLQPSSQTSVPLGKAPQLQTLEQHSTPIVELGKNVRHQYSFSQLNYTFDDGR